MAAAAAVLTAVLSAILLHRGVILSPDGWAYWEGSVSILEGLGYRYFGGQEITHFPPLFPVFLAVWQWFSGISGRALAMALLVLGALSAAVWSLLFQKVLPNKSSWAYRFFLSIYFPTFFASYYRSLLSETLALLLLGWLLLLMTRAVAQSLSERRVLHLSAGIGFLATLLLLCRNSAIAFLPGIAILVFWLGRHERPVVRMLGSVAAVLVPLSLWHLVRQQLGQVDSVAFGPAGESVEHLSNALTSLAYLLGPDEWYLGYGALLGLLASLVVVSVSHEPGEANERSKVVSVRFLLAFAAAALLTRVLLFSLAWVHDPLAGRFLWFVPLLLVGSATALSAQEHRLLPRLLVLGFLTGLVALQVYRTATFVRGSLRADYRPHVGPNVTISPDWIDKPPKTVNTRVLISPPDFPWIDRGSD